MDVGLVIAERFDIETLVGAGGMGRVYRARDRLTGEPAAVKFVSQMSSSLSARFQREARLLASLQHPGIVRYITHGTTTTGEHYLVMEWVEGEELGRRLRRTGMSLDESLAMARRIADALAHAHGRGLVHRDLNPRNILLAGREPDRPKLVDFGVALLKDPGEEPLTRTGGVVGTPGYMSPEQVLGGREVDARADIYAFGCVLFECLAGQRPFPGERNLAVWARTVFEVAPRLRAIAPGVPPALDQLVAEMLSIEPAERPADGAAVGARLAAVERAPVEPAGPSALSAGERRLFAVIVCGSARGTEDMTIDDAAPRSRIATSVERPRGRAAPDPARAAALRAGASAERLLDGSLVASMTGDGAATDLAARAAVLALDLRRLTAAPIALAIGRGEAAGPLPIGDVIDRAAALCEALADEPFGVTVRIDDVTAGLLDERFEVGGDPGGLDLRGERSDPGIRLLLGRPTACVGRAAELGALGSLFDAVASGGTAAAALITGPPGIGKSRLRYELCRHVREVRPDASIWIARGDPLSGGSPFALAARAVRAAAGIADGEPLDVQRRKLSARVGRHLADEAHAATTEFLAELIGAPFEAREVLAAARRDPKIMGDQIRRAWEAFLEAESCARPLVLVLEDLHWGDLPTVHLVDAALRALAERPFFLLALARPEIDDVFPTLWSRRSLHRIRLGELGRAAAGELCRSVLGGAAAPELVDRVVRLAGGNAFSLEELIRAAAAGGAAALPPTVIAMVQARLEGLSPDGRRLLRAASVFGQVFWAGGVAALVGGDAGEAQDWLDALVGEELISRRGRSRFPLEVEFSFRHDLVREAAHASLTDADRRLGHRLAGDWLETVGERDPGVLAEHFASGGATERAAGLFARSAAQALEGNDLAAVIDRAGRARACGPDGELAGEIHRLAATAHLWLGDYVEADRLGRIAMDLLAPGSEEWYSAGGDLLTAAERRSLPDRIVEVADRLLEVDPGRPSPALAAAIARAASHLYLAGRAADAERYLVCAETELAVLESVAPAVAGHVLTARANERRVGAGDLWGSLVSYQRAAELFDRGGDLRSGLLTRANLAYAWVQLGGYAEAEPILRELVAAGEQHDLPMVTWLARQNLGRVLGELGAFEEARVHGTGALANYESLGDRRMATSSRIYLSIIEELAGDLARAGAYARAAVEGAAPGRQLGEALARLAAVRLAAGDPSGALDSARAARSEGGLDEVVPELWLVMARAAAAEGREAEARALVLEAWRSLEARAAPIADPAWRERFRRGIRCNAEITSIAAAWAIPR
ncbi:MAG TPA: protein kinase [Kofleriaceae bacterium]|nr:protein kinase [Kofleriaceae bacterium]